ncbi:MAG: hypothetical protein R3A51_08050 [Nannocystaceae bacterium]
MSDDDATRLYDALCELEIDSATLRRDPDGATWLPDHLRTLVDAAPGHQQILRDWVEDELDLFDSVKVRDDLTFTSRVVEAAGPEEIAGAGLAPERRGYVLAVAYAAAVALAILLVRSLVGESSIWGWLVHNLREALGR